MTDYIDRPKLKPKRSWIGNMIRNVVAQGALTAKAAVDAVRERIDGPSTPMLVETSDVAEIFTSPESPNSKRRPRQTQSVRNRLSSIRARLPRRSLDTKRHASVDVFSPLDVKAHAFLATPRSKSITLLAAEIPLPSSPVPLKAPSLSIDLGSSRLISEEQGDNEREPVHNYDLTTVRLPTPLMQVIAPEQDRAIVVKRLSVEVQQSADISSSEITSTDAHTYIDGMASHSQDPASLTQEAAAILPLRPVSQHASLVSQETPMMMHVTPMAASSHVMVRKDSILGTSLDNSSVSKLSTPQCKEKSGIISGPPSPDKSIALPLRPKISNDNSSFHTPFISRIESNSDGSRIGFSTGSPRSRKTPRLVSRGRQPGSSPRTQRSAQDLAVSILRERTDDHLRFPDRLAELSKAVFNAAPEITSPANTVANSPEAAYRQLQQSTSYSVRRPQTPVSGKSDRLSLPSHHGYLQQRVRSNDPSSSPDKSLIKENFTHGFRQNSSSPNSFVNQYCVPHNRLSLLTDLDDSAFDTSSDSEFPLLYT